MNLKALTVRQPWADLIVGGDKLIENRSWTSTYRGWVLIHASKTWDDYDDLPLQLSESRLNEMWSSAIIGAAHLERVLDEESALSEFDCPSDAPRYPWVNGPKCWVFSKVVRFPDPIGHVGQMGLWTPDKAALLKCRKLLAGL